MAGRCSIPSCGLALLRGPPDAFDYTLWLLHGKQCVKVLCHKAVLLAHSPVLCEIIRDANFWDCSVRVKDGYLNACLELLQYCYCKDPTLISDVSKVLDMAAMFKMSYDHMVISNRLAVATDRYERVLLQIEPEEHSIAVCADFLKCLSFPNSKLVAKTRQIPLVDAATQTLIPESPNTQLLQVLQEPIEEEVIEQKPEEVLKEKEQEKEKEEEEHEPIKPKSSKKRPTKDNNWSEPKSKKKKQRVLSPMRLTRSRGAMKRRRQQL